MKFYKYLNCSMMGSYYVDCEVLEEFPEQKLVRYHCDIQEKEVDEIVDSSRVKEYIPSFNVRNDSSKITNLARAYFRQMIESSRLGYEDTDSIYSTNHTS